MSLPSEHLQMPRFWQHRKANQPEELVDSTAANIVVAGMAVVAGAATRRLLQSTWRRLRGSEPPYNPAAPEVTWADALIWAAAVGATVGVARALSRRGTTAAVRRFQR